MTTTSTTTPTTAATMPKMPPVVNPADDDASVLRSFTALMVALNSHSACALEFCAMDRVWQSMEESFTRTFPMPMLWSCSVVDVQSCVI